METGNNTPHNAPHPSVPQRPIQRRPAIDGFITRRPGPTLGGAPAPTAPSHPHHTAHTVQPAAAQQHSAPQKPQPVHVSTTPLLHHMAAPRPMPTAAHTQPHPTAAHATVPVQHVPTAHTVGNGQPMGAQARPAPAAMDMLSSQRSAPSPATAVADPAEAPADKTVKPPKERNQTGHAGLVGFAVFVVLGALLVVPLLPGKAIDSLPLNSQTFSTGDESLGCIGTPTNSKTTTTYNTKAGSPLTYRYATSTKQTATCDSKTRSATVGQTSLFSPLALAADVLVAAVAACGVTLVWRLIFGQKKHQPRHRDGDM